MEAWKAATARYKEAEERATGSPTEPPKPARVNLKPPEPAQTLRQFVDSPDGRAARELLAASGRWILLAESEAAMSRSTSVVFDGEGLKKSHQVVGMAAAYTKEIPTAVLIDSSEALELIDSFADPRSTPRDIVAYIKSELDKIAAQAPP